MLITVRRSGFQAAFSKMRSRHTDLGITTVSCCNAQRMSTCAGVRPMRAAISRILPSCRRRPRVSGL